MLDSATPRVELLHEVIFRPSTMDKVIYSPYNTNTSYVF